MGARSLLLVAVLASTGCGILPPLDAMGVDASVWERDDLAKEPSLEDDRLEDKSPRYDESLTVVEEFDGCEVTLNKSGSITRLDILELEGADIYFEDRLFRDRRAALDALAELGHDDVLPSIEVINGWLKGVNDGIYAGIEVDYQLGGVGGVEGKQDFLLQLLDALDDASIGATSTQREHLDEATVHIAAAATLGGAPVAVEPRLSARVAGAIARFREDPLRARPIGFYTWSTTLEGVFEQDRFLQAGAPFGVFAALAVVLEMSPQLAERYEQLVALYGGLTNPGVSYPVSALFGQVSGRSSLDHVGALEADHLAAFPWLSACDNLPRIAFLPASRSRETEYFCEHGVQGNLIDALIAALTDGSLDATPSADSGWYDWQLHSLEVLLRPEVGPESDHLFLTAAYKKKLVETFKSLITQTRETHVKSLAMETLVSLPPPKVDVYPKLPAEPFPTFYLRTARAYRFLRTVLAAVLGESFIAESTRYRETGSRSDELVEILDETIARLYGLAMLTARSLGVDHRSLLLPDESAEVDLAAATAEAELWLEGWRQDRDVLADPRVIVPIQRDELAGLTTYWAVIGIKVLAVRAEFVAGYEPEIVSMNGCELREIVDKDYYLLLEEMVQVDLDADAPPPTRDELRAVCDAMGSREAIINALRSL